MESMGKHELAASVYPVGKRELFFGLGILAGGLLLANVTVYGGFNLGFAIAVTVCIICNGAYLLVSARKANDGQADDGDQNVGRSSVGKVIAGRSTAYSLALLGLSVVIAASFARSDDGFVKFVMVCFLMVSVNLGLCLLAGRNRRNPGTVGSLSDAGFTLFTLGVGEMTPAGRGVKAAFRNSGSVGRKSGAVLLGLGMAIPVLLIIIPLLNSADAAFAGLLDKLPEFSFAEFLTTILLGGIIAGVLYTRGTALKYYVGDIPEAKVRKKLASLTVNTVLVAVCFVYGVYLISQLAYFTGGFAGILPEGYTLSQYARRGFFEMALLCGVNLSIMVFSLWICREKAPTPLSTRILCLFIGIVTLFFVAAASAKMILYIDSYGLTRLRVLTQVIMVFLGIVTALVCVWLFVPRLPYMKAVILIALIIGAAVSWADVDTQVARYNVNAYLDGRMETVDVGYLMNRLGDGAIPYLVKLQEEATDAQVLEDTRIALEYRKATEIEDFRSWNYAEWKAAEYLGDKAEYRKETAE